MRTVAAVLIRAIFGIFYSDICAATPELHFGFNISPTNGYFKKQILFGALVSAKDALGAAFLCAYGHPLQIPVANATVVRVFLPQQPARASARVWTFPCPVALDICVNNPNQLHALATALTFAKHLRPGSGRFAGILFSLGIRRKTSHILLHVGGRLAQGQKRSFRVPIAPHLKQNFFRGRTSIVGVPQVCTLGR